VSKYSTGATVEIRRKKEEGNDDTVFLYINRFRELTELTSMTGKRNVSAGSTAGNTKHPPHQHRKGRSVYPGIKKERV